MHLAADNNILLHRLQRGRFVIVKWETNIFCNKRFFNYIFFNTKYFILDTKTTAGTCENENPHLSFQNTDNHSQGFEIITAY